jgi:hypothetical protein
VLIEFFPAVDNFRLLREPMPQGNVSALEHARRAGHPIGDYVESLDSCGTWQLNVQNRHAGAEPA